MRQSSIIDHLKYFTVVLTVVAIFSASAAAQDAPTAEEEKKPEPTASAAAKTGEFTAEQIVESTIIIYGIRQMLNQIRKTTHERGKTTITGADGAKSTARYDRYVIRGENLATDKLRLDQEFPNSRYAMIFDQNNVYGIFNNNVFAPLEDASRTFQNQIVRSIDSLLRYKENESKIENSGKDKIMGVDYYLIDMTDTAGRTTRYFISAKTFRVMMLEYTEGGNKFVRKFYNHRIAQGTLVPYRSVLTMNDRIVEETEIGTITFGQRVDEGLFARRP